MPFGTIETLASIFVILGAVKLIIILINPSAWFNFSKKVYYNPKLTSSIALVLAIIVLYYLINAGMTILHILAAGLFISLIIVTGISKYSKELMNWMERKGPKQMMKEQCFYILIWLALIVWGIVVLVS